MTDSEHPSNYEPEWAIPDKADMRDAGRLYSHHIRTLFENGKITQEQGQLAVQQWRDFYHNLFNGTPRQYNHGYDLYDFFYCDDEQGGCGNWTPVTVVTFNYLRYVQAPEANHVTLGCYFHYKPRVNTAWLMPMPEAEAEVLASGWPPHLDAYPSADVRANFEQTFGIKIKPIGKLEELDQAEFEERLGKIVCVEDIVW